MLAQSQTTSTNPVHASKGEISAADLLAMLGQNRDKKLLFNYGGRDVLPGYHVTEVKTGEFQALDCGANYETWHEIFIQLWDVPPSDDRGVMPVGKFLAIIDKVAKAIAFDSAAKMTFEVSDGEQAMQLYRAAAIETVADTVRVTLTERPASCKPRDRWLDQQETARASCCAPAAKNAKCCN